jgi:hypothetical protein
MLTYPQGRAPQGKSLQRMSAATCPVERAVWQRFFSALPPQALSAGLTTEAC